jgi:hypothetical protein
VIEKYLLSNCLFIIDEFNERYNNINDKKELKEIADTDFCEADIVVRLGYPFRQMANFNMQGTANDIVVKSKDFIIEVKYLRNFRSNSKTFRTNKLNWEEAFQKDYNWLCNEIKNGKKGHRAFVLAWFNAVERFSEVMKLGEGSGQSPDINESRIRLFPFLNRLHPDSKKTKDIFYMYESAYEPIPIQIIGYGKESVHCMFLGKESDKFHLAIYW